jgi:hypothetical protein
MGTLSSGTTETLVPAGEGVAFPLGTLDTFVSAGNTVGMQKVVL